MPDPTPMERRRDALAEGFQKRVELMAAMMRPDDKPVFHTRLSGNDAYSFWQAHRFDDLGKAVISTWKPDQILALDQKLAQMNQQRGLEVPPGDGPISPPAY